MFADFANVWTIIGAADELRSEALLARTIGGERVVLFRDAGGKPCALIDRCPHRGVQLSLGRLREGVVECPFHGWRFDGAGRNCGVPWNPDARREQLGAVALPVRELHGLLWLHTGPNAADEPDPTPTLALPGIHSVVQHVTWRTHWTRAMENMLDMPHLPFVHAATIGRAVKEDSAQRMELRWTPTERGARIENTSPGRTSTGRLDYLYPNTMELTIDPPGKTLRILSVCLPEDAGTTRMIFVSLRSFARTRLLDPFFRHSNRRIAREDQAILESSDPVEVPPAGQERSVRTDGPTLAFRKIWFERLKGSEA